MRLSKTMKIFLVAFICAGLIGLAAASFLLSVDLGSINVNENIYIESASMNGVDGVVAGNGQSVTFSNLPDMTVGDTTTLTVTIHNAGGTAVNVSTIVVSGAGSVLTFTPQFGSLPISISAGANYDFIWDVEAVLAGTVTPSISFS